MQCCFILLLCSGASASERIPDIVFYRGELYHIYDGFPLDSFLAEHTLYPRQTDAPMMVTQRGQMDGTDNPNFHIANWVIQDKRLQLADIEGYVYLNFNSWYLESIEKSLESAKNEDERKRLNAEAKSLQDSGISRRVLSAMDHFFPKRNPGQFVFAQWFSGTILVEKQVLETFSSKIRQRFEMSFHQGILQSVRPL